MSDNSTRAHAPCVDCRTADEPDAELLRERTAREVRVFFMPDVGFDLFGEVLISPLAIRKASQVHLRFPLCYYSGRFSQRIRLFGQFTEDEPDGARHSAPAVGRGVEFLAAFVRQAVELRFAVVLAYSPLR